MRYFLPALALCVSAVCVMVPGRAFSASDELGIDATIVQALNVDCTRKTLSFGDISPSAGASLINVNAAGTGVISKSGNASILNDADADRGECMVTGAPDQYVVVTINDVAIDNGNGGSMPVKNFQIHSATGTGAADAGYEMSLGSTGEAVLGIGADLEIGNKQAVGSYGGTVTVEVEYQ